MLRNKCRGLRCESEEDDSADEAKEHADNRADEDYAGASCYFL